MTKKLPIALLGFTLIFSAFLISGNASVNYAHILDRKIKEDQTLRRFSGGMRRGTSNSFQKENITPKTLNRRFGFIRPRVTKSESEESLSNTKKRTFTNRINSFSASNSPKDRASNLYKINNIVFSDHKDVNTFHANEFVLEIDKSLTKPAMVETDEFVLENEAGIKLLIKKLPKQLVDSSFEPVARALADKELANNLELKSFDQAKKIVSQVRKNQIGINQTPPTNFFETVNLVDKYNVKTVVVQRIQENPNGGFYYLEMSGPEKLIKTVMDMANVSFKTFNLR